MSGSGYFLLSAEATFSAAHTLPGAGACEQMHGHNWRVWVGRSTGVASRTTVFPNRNP